MARNTTWHVISMPWPSGLLFGNWTVSAKTLAEVRAACAKTGEEVRVIKAYSTPRPPRRPKRR